jgi:uroporphyrin-3 C-methyltransferase
VPDIQGMVLILDSMQSKSPQMQLKVSILPEARRQAIQNNSEKISFKDWDKVIERVWRELRTLVVIKKHDQPLAPVLTIEQQQTIRHILQLKIQGIRTALLNKQPEIFLVSIEETLGWLKEHFSVDDSNVSLLESRLQEFKAVRLKIDLPDISGSLSTLQSLKKQLKIIPAPEGSTAAPPDASIDKTDLQTMESL